MCVCFDVQGENARMASFVGAIAIADMVKTTLGPKGMDKILQSVRPDPSISIIIYLYKKVAY